MNDYREITTLGIIFLLIIFAMAVYASPAPMVPEEGVTVEEIVELPEEHPGGFELLLAKIDAYEK